MTTSTMFIRNSVAALFLCLVGVTQSFAQTQYNTLVPDSSFNKLGYRRMQPMLYNPAFVTTADGRMIVAASNSGQVGTATAMNLNVTKLKNDGTPDSSFGQGSAFSANILANEPTVNQFSVKSIKLQNDGKIVILGAAANQLSGSQYDNSAGWIFLARLKANGQRDSTFNGNGILFTKTVAGHEYRPGVLAIDENNGSPVYYVGGNASEYGNWFYLQKFFIARYKNDGALDTSFRSVGYMQGNGSIIHVAQNTGTVGNFDMKVVNDRKLVVAGAHGGSKFFMFRLKVDGSFDSSFAGTGRVLRSVGFIAALNALGTTYILPDNSVAFTGEDIIYTFSTTGYDSLTMHMARQNADGTPLMNFGVSGELHHAYVSRSGYHKEAFDDQNRIMHATYKHIGTTASQKIHFTRFKANGTIDNTFGTNGELASEPILQDAWVNPSALIGGLNYADNFKKIYLAGTYSRPGNDGGIIAFRYKFPEIVTSGVAGVNILNAKIYPNPVKDDLHIELPDGRSIKSVSVTDMTGKIVMKWSVISGNNTFLSLHQLPAGQYLLQITDENNGSASKLFTKY